MSAPEHAARARPRMLAAIPALALVAIAAWETCATRVDASSVPDDTAWDRAAAIVRAGFAPGDLIVFAPDWVDPVGRLHLGDLISVDTAARMDAARYRRIWEVSIRGARAPETAGLRATSAQELAGVTVARYDRPPVAVVSAIVDPATLATARADDGEHPRAVIAEVGFAPHRCVQITPRPGHPVRVTFPQLALGSQLVAYVGLADVFKRREHRRPAQLDVEIGGQVIATASPGIDDGWVKLAAPTLAGSADVTFIATADEADRELCFAAEARE